MPSTLYQGHLCSLLSPWKALSPSNYMVFFPMFVVSCSSQRSTLNSFFLIFLLFIYSHVHTLFGSFLPPAPLPHLLTPSPLSSMQVLYTAVSLWHSHTIHLNVSHPSQVLYVYPSLLAPPEMHFAYFTYYHNLTHLVEG
jgi:hypothetical protein